MALWANSLTKSGESVSSLPQSCTCIDTITQSAKCFAFSIHLRFRFKSSTFGVVMTLYSSPAVKFENSNLGYGAKLVLRN